MTVKQVNTGKEYQMSKDEWESLGARQKLFQVLNAQDAPTGKQRAQNTLPVQEKPVKQQLPTGEAAKTDEKAGKTKAETKTNKK